MSGPTTEPSPIEPATPRHQTQSHSHAQTQPQHHHPEVHPELQDAPRMDTVKDTSDDNLHPAPAAAAAAHRFSSAAVPFPPQTPIMPHPPAHSGDGAAAAAAPGGMSGNSDDGAMDVDHTTPRAATSLQLDLDQMQQPAQQYPGNGRIHGDHNTEDDDDDVPIFLSTPVQTDESNDKVERLQTENSLLRQQLARSYKQMEEFKSLRTTEVEAILRDHREISSARYEVSESRRLELEQLKTIYESRIHDLERELSQFRTGTSRPPTSAPAPPAPSTATDPSAPILLNIAEQLSGMMLEMPQPGVINVAQQPMDVPDSMDPQALTFAFQLIQLPPAAGGGGAESEAGGAAPGEEAIGGGSGARYLYKPVRVPDHMAEFFKVETEVEQELLGKLYSRLLQDLVPVDE